MSNCDSCNGPGQFKLYKILSERGLNSHMTYEIVHSTKSEYVSKLINMVKICYHRHKLKNHRNIPKICSSLGADIVCTFSSKRRYELTKHSCTTKYISGSKYGK